MFKNVQYLLEIFFFLINLLTKYLTYDKLQVALLNFISKKYKKIITQNYMFESTINKKVKKRFTIYHFV